MKFNFHLSLILIFLFTVWSFAQEPENEFLTLEDCIEIALTNNSLLKSAQYNRDMSEMDVRGSYSGILPRVDFSISKGERVIGQSEYLSDEPVGIDSTTGQVIYEQRVRKISKSTRKTNSADLTVSQTLYNGGIWWNQIRQARAINRSSDYFLDSQENFVILSVQQSYFDLLKQIKLLEANEVAVARSQAQLDRAEKMFELGATARVDVYRAKVNLGNDRIAMLTQRNTVEQSEKQLNLAMGRDPLTPLTIDASLDLPSSLPTMDELLETAIENQPMLRKYEEDIRTRRLSTEMAKGIMHPRLSIYYNYGRFNENFEELYTDLNQNYQSTYGVQLSFNIFNGFSDYADIQKAKINQKAAMEDKEEYKRTLISNIHQYYTNYKSYLEIIVINEENLEAAKEDLRLAEERYQIGAGTALEVREAQVNLARAEQTLIAAQYNARITLAQLDDQLGISSIKMEGAE
jgi:outer membrane protein TolC